MTGPKPVLRLSGAATTWVLLLSLGLAALLLFYCLRARATFRRMVPRYAQGVRLPEARPASWPMLKSDLNKIRRTGTPLLLLLLLALGGATEVPDQLTRVLLTAGVAGACFGCCAQLIQVRRGLWEVARIEGAVFAAASARGFTVMPAGDGSGGPPEPGGPVAAVPVVEPFGPLSAVPVAAVPMASVAAPGEREQAEAFTDWETLLNWLAGFALAGNALILPGFLNLLGAFAEAVTSGGPRWFPSDPRDLAFVGVALLCDATALGWLLWGVVCLSAGPRLRWAVLTLAWVGLGLSASAVVLVLFRGDDSSHEVRPALLSWLAGQGRMGASGALELAFASGVLPAVMLLVVTRPAARAVFAYRPRRGRRA